MLLKAEQRNQGIVNRDGSCEATRQHATAKQSPGTDRAHFQSVRQQGTITGSAHVCDVLQTIIHQCRPYKARRHAWPLLIDQVLRQILRSLGRNYGHAILLCG